MRQPRSFADEYDGIKAKEFLALRGAVRAGAQASRSRFDGHEVMFQKDVDALLDSQRKLTEVLDLDDPKKRRGSAMIHRPSPAMAWQRQPSPLGFGRTAKRELMGAAAVAGLSMVNPAFGAVTGVLLATQLGGMARDAVKTAPAPEVPVVPGRRFNWSGPADDRHAAQMSRLQRSAQAVFRDVTSDIQAVGKLNAKQGIDILAPGMLPNPAARLNHQQVDRIAENGGFGGLDDVGIDTRKLMRGVQKLTPHPHQVAALQGMRPMFAPPALGLN